MSELNSMYFTNKDQALDFIKTLLDLSITDEEFCNDIHVYNEDEAILVEWVQRPYSGEYGGSIQYIKEDQQVMYEREFPDNHCEFFFSEDEYKEALDEWLKEHPTYKQNQWGRWYDERDYADLK